MNIPNGPVVTPRRESLISPGPVQTIVLINPLIYVNEGMRAAFTNAPHMHLYVIYPVVVGFGALFLAIGLRQGFRRRGTCCPAAAALKKTAVSCRRPRTRSPMPSPTVNQMAASMATAGVASAR